jgi:hypothetical protein
MGGACGMLGEKGNARKVLVGKSEGKRSLEDIGVNGRITLKLMFKKQAR